MDTLLARRIDALYRHHQLLAEKTLKWCLDLEERLTLLGTRLEVLVEALEDREDRFQRRGGTPP